MRFDDFQGRSSGVTRVSAQVLVSPQRGIGSLDHDRLQHGLQLRDIMPVGSGHDERQRDATTVHQQMAFAPVFFPDPLDLGPRWIAPVALSSSHRQCFAIARRCLQHRRTRQVQLSKELQRGLLSPIQESGHGSRWRYRNVQPGALSIGNRFSTRKRCPRRPVADLSADGHLPLCVGRFDPLIAGVSVLTVRLASKNHP